jgi:3-oxoacyl-[acyl-carrier protein] reductase
MQIDLSTRVALVTGSTRGIGREIASTLAACGARVAVVGRDLARAESVAAELSGARGFAADLADPPTVRKLIEDVETAFGSIDILVNNAGLTRDNILLRLKDDDWDAVLDANLRGAFLTIRAAIRGMMKRRWGRIINISSVVGLIGNKGQANYAASKAGLIGLTKSVAKELASRNILSNAIAPGFIETDMTAALTDEVRQGLTSQIPLERLGTPSDIASLVAYLASDHAGYITGQVFVVDGGMVM